MRKATRFKGVQQRESSTKRWNGRADICYTIDYIEPISKKRVRKDIGWASEGFTAAYANQMRNDILSKKAEAILPLQHDDKPTTITLLEAWEKYSKEWLIARNKRYKADSSMFNKNLCKWHNLPLSDFTPYVLDNIISTLTQKGLSAQSVRYMVSMIRRVMRKMQNWGLYDGELPFNKIVLPKVNNRRERFLTVQEATTLLDALAQRSQTVYMQALISLHCGLRFGEIAALTITDIDFSSNNMFIRDSKSGKSRHTVMTDTVAKALGVWLVEKRPTNLLFPDTNGNIQTAVSSTFERTVDSLGFNSQNGQIDGTRITDRRQKVVFHTLRHTYASWLAMAGMGQAMIADLLGHSSLEMSARYTHLFPDERRSSASKIDSIFISHK